MPKRITTKAELAALLGTLGATADEIAANLITQGVKGEMSQAHHCPIANWLKREVEGASLIEVDADDIRVTIDDTYELRYETSLAVERFIDKFDDEFYVDLVADFAVHAD